MQQVHSRCVICWHKVFCHPLVQFRPRAVQWAKSYNLGWKWCTGGGRRSNNSKKVKQSHKLDGFGLLVLKTPDLQDMSYYLVVDRFSRSVCFFQAERLHKTFR